MNNKLYSHSKRAKSTGKTSEFPERPENSGVCTGDGGWGRWGNLPRLSYMGSDALLMSQTLRNLERLPQAIFIVTLHTCSRITERTSVKCYFY